MAGNLAGKERTRKVRQTFAKMGIRQTSTNMMIFMLLIMSVILVPLGYLVVSNALKHEANASRTSAPSTSTINAATTLPTVPTAPTTTTASDSTTTTVAEAPSTVPSSSTTTLLSWECDADSDCRNDSYTGCKIGNFYKFTEIGSCIGHRCVRGDAKAELVRMCLEGEYCDDGEGCMPLAGNASATTLPTTTTTHRVTTTTEAPETTTTVTATTTSTEASTTSSSASSTTTSSTTTTSSAPTSTTASSTTTASSSTSTTTTVTPTTSTVTTTTTTLAAPSGRPQ